jgi:hypothetical protein
MTAWIIVEIADRLVRLTARSSTRQNIGYNLSVTTCTDN